MPSAAGIVFDLLDAYVQATLHAGEQLAEGDLTTSQIIKYTKGANVAAFNGLKAVVTDDLSGTIVGAAGTYAGETIAVELIGSVTLQASVPILAAIAASPVAMPLAVVLTGLALGAIAEAFYEANADELDQDADNMVNAAMNGLNALGNDVANGVTDAEHLASTFLTGFVQSLLNLPEASSDLYQAILSKLNELGNNIDSWLGPSMPALQSTYQNPYLQLGLSLGGYMKNIASQFGRSMVDPIVLDLSGTGIQLVAEQNSNAYFDLYDTGFAVKTGWIGPQTGFLVQDLNNNGQIDNITELFGSSSTDGFSALSALDSNHDGVVDSNDPGFSQLAIWVDANGNGVTDSGELYTLAQLGITSINLATTVENEEVGGNLIGEIGAFTRSDGTTGQVAEAYFANSQLDSQFEGNVTVNPDVLALPILRGYGTIPDLYSAMSLDPTLLQMVQNLTTDSMTDAASFGSQVAAIIYRWAGVDSVDPTSRGPYVNAQQLGSLEEFTGQTYTDAHGSTDPQNTSQGVAVESAWNAIFDEVQAHLLIQGPLASLFPGLSYDFTDDTLTGSVDLNSVIAAIGASAPTDPAQAQQYWTTLSAVITTVGNDLGIPKDQYLTSLANAISSADVPFTVDQILNGTVYIGTSGADRFVATVGNNPAYFDGAGGNDYAQGSLGDDTFVFGPGYSQLEISEGVNGSLNSTAILDLGAGISVTQVAVTGDNSGNIYLTDGITGDQVKIDGMLNKSSFYGSYGGVNQITFADGTVWTRQQIVSMETTGTTGNDHLYGTVDADVFDGKGGTDYEQGNGGADTFIYNPGYGQLEISEGVISSSNSTAALQLGAGISASQVKVTGDSSGNIYLTDGITGDQIKIDGMLNESSFWHSYGGVQQVNFADGTALTRQQILSMETTGTTGNDHLYGTVDADVFDGKGGTDYEQGNGGADTFIYNPHYGQLEISEGVVSSSNSTATLQLGSGLSVSQAKVSTDSSGNIYLTDGITGDQVKIDGMMMPSSFWGSYGGVNQITFADGTIWTRQQIMNMITTSGTSGNDRIFGTVNADVLDGKGGNDYVQGNGGADTFIYNPGYGQLEINEAVGTSSNTTATLQLGAGISASQVKVTGDSSGNIYLTDGITGDQVKIDGMLNKSSFGWYGGVNQIVFADGTVWSRQQILSMEMTGTTGNDHLYGTVDVNVFDGKGGTDYEQGNGGADTFIYNPGYGQLEISEGVISSSNSTAILQLGAGISASQVKVTGDSSSNIYLTDGITGDQIKIDGMLNESSFWHSYGGVQQVNFADGTALTRQQILSMEMTGTTGNDHLYGTVDADVFDGKGGTDYEQGNGGADTFIYNPGYGQLEISEGVISSSNSTATLQWGAGISASQVAVTGDSSGNIYLTDGIAGDQIKIDGMLNESSFWHSYGGVQQVNFADGTVWTRQQILSMEMTGTTGNDHLYGTADADVFDGKGGNDYEQGNAGADTFTYNPHYGQLEISEGVVSSSNSTATLQLGAGISASQVSVTKDASGNIYLTDGIAGDQVKIDGMLNQSSFWHSYGGVQQVNFADGTVWTRQQVDFLATTGTTGTDTITGTTGNDIIDGRGGSDTAIGNGGYDTYLFRPGYGHLTINNATASGSTADGELDFAPGITESNLWLSETGQDLTLSVLGTQNSVTISNWFGTNPSAQLTEIKAGDGLKLDSQVTQLVAAMANFQTNNPGFDPTTATQMPTDNNLQTSIAAAWHA